MRWMPRSSAAASPTAANRRLPTRSMRSAPTVRGWPASSISRRPAPASSRSPIARLRNGSTAPSKRSAARWTAADEAERVVSQVSVTINGRQFRMACEDGQEGHLMNLARDLDARIDGLRAKFGEIGDTRLTVMAALTIADTLSETTQRIKRLEEEVADMQAARTHSGEH